MDRRPTEGGASSLPKVAVEHRRDLEQDPSCLATYVVNFLGGFLAQSEYEQLEQHW